MSVTASGTSQPNALEPQTPSSFSRKTAIILKFILASLEFSYVEREHTLFFKVLKWLRLFPMPSRSKRALLEASMPNINNIK